MKVKNKFYFSTKAQNLFNIRTKIKSFLFTDFYFFTLNEWVSEKRLILKKIKKIFLNKKIAIRSSSVYEDQLGYSFAGSSKTFLNISLKKNNDKKIVNLINQVIKSYKNPVLQNEILIHKMVNNPLISGVITTKHLNSNGPYISINYYKSYKTDIVTSGVKSTQTINIFKKTKKLPKKFKIFNNLYKATIELLNFVNGKDLDIEFVLDNHFKPYLIQFRPLINKYKYNENYIINKISKLLKQEKRFFNQANKNQKGLLGKKNIFATMPDWNPAEIIGKKPNTLAVSLYKYLITDNLWSIQRKECGYKNVKNFPLMKMIAKQPFIDLKVDINSFLPENMENKTNLKLYNHYLKKFLNNPNLHDKLEFEIVLTCLDLNFEERSKELKASNFTQNEITKLKKELNLINKKIIFNTEKSLKKISYSNNNLKKIKSINKIFDILEKCKIEKILPFAHLARGAFFSIIILNSMVKKKIISQKDLSNILLNVKTVAKQLVIDKANIHKKNFNIFLEKYGHLRPGTYDITIPSYSENPDMYFDKKKTKIKKYLITPKKYSLPKYKLKKIENKLEALGFPKDVNYFLKFVTKSIEGREMGKFLFSKDLSNVLNKIKQFFKSQNINYEEAANLDIFFLKSLFNTKKNFIKKKSMLRNHLKKNKISSEISKKIEFPEIISSTNDLYVFSTMASTANFIGRKKIIGYSFVVDFKNLKKNELKNKIVFIENADPGYDWMFDFDIKGLVTKYGGQNSHMAIRSTELNIVSIIGANDIYDKYKNYKYPLLIDPKNRIITCV